MILKVCGVYEKENIRAVIEQGVAMIGLNFEKGNPRFVKMYSSNSGIQPDYSSLQVDAIKKNKDILSFANVKVFGVFKDDMPQNIITRIYNFKLNGVQLNGAENTVMIDNLKTTVIGDIAPALDVIKTIEVNSYDDLNKALPFEGHADMIFYKLNPTLLVPQEISKTVEALNNFTSTLPFFVGGTADESFLNALKEIKNEAFLGLNVDAEIETEESLKDIEKLQSLQQVLAR